MLLEKFFWYVIFVLFIIVQVIIMFYYRRAFKKSLARSRQELHSTANSIYQDIVAIEKQGQTEASPQ